MSGLSFNEHLSFTWYESRVLICFVSHSFLIPLSFSQLVCKPSVWCPRHTVCRLEQCKACWILTPCASALVHPWRVWSFSSLETPTSSCTETQTIADRRSDVCAIFFKQPISLLLFNFLYLCSANCHTYWMNYMYCTLFQSVQNRERKKRSDHFATSTRFLDEACASFWNIFLIKFVHHHIHPKGFQLNGKQILVWANTVFINWLFCFFWWMVLFYK